MASYKEVDSGKEKGLELIGGDLKDCTGDHGGEAWVEEKDVFIGNSQHGEKVRKGRILLNLIREAR